MRPSRPRASISGNRRSEGCIDGLSIAEPEFAGVGGTSESFDPLHRRGRERLTAAVQVEPIAAPLRPRARCGKKREEGRALMPLFAREDARRGMLSTGHLDTRQRRWRTPSTSISPPLTSSARSSTTSRRSEVVSRVKRWPLAQRRASVEWIVGAGRRSCRTDQPAVSPRPARTPRRARSPARRGVGRRRSAARSCHRCRRCPARSSRALARCPP